MQDDDFRFVTKDGKLYAFVMKPDNRKTAVITSLHDEERVKKVVMLGNGELEYVQHSGVLIVDLPEKRCMKYPNVLERTF